MLERGPPRANKIRATTQVVTAENELCALSCCHRDLCPCFGGISANIGKFATMKKKQKRKKKRNETALPSAIESPP